MKKTLIILNYHQIINDSDTQNRESTSPYAIKVSDFSAHISLIKDRGISVISLSDWRNNIVKNDLSIILTFDDGHSSDYNIVFNKLLEEEMTASFFPILSLIGEKERVKWSQLKEMTNNQYEIGSHGINHKNLLHLNKEERLLELTKSKHVIEEKIGQSVEAISLPFGMYNNKLIKMIQEAGYKFALTTRVKSNTSKDAFLMHRINIKSDTSLVEFDQILSLNKRVMIKNKFFSDVSFMANKLFGVSWINSLREKY